MNAPGQMPKVVVSLGTDHHRFNRLVDWIDQWMEQRQTPVDCVVQHGFSRAPRYATAVERMPRHELLELYRQSEIVVVQGGPGSILDAREVGRVPIAVPRRPELDEVVDGHQIIFTDIMSKQGDAIMAEDYAGFVLKLEAAIAQPATVTTAPRVARPDIATYKLEEAIFSGFLQSDKGRTRRRLKQLIGAKGNPLAASGGPGHGGNP
ncbi:glycosyl transferase [Specibacter sp. NPDC057265]|uniref:glycosyl transferase n=1 Tax=Specibacter sp. NPDC057265 TaxID=3346075 RepID=UPI00362B34F2